VSTDVNARSENAALVNLVYYKLKKYEEKLKNKSSNSVRVQFRERQSREPEKYK